MNVPVADRLRSTAVGAIDLSRRNVLKIGCLLLPGLLGARLFSPPPDAPLPAPRNPGAVPVAEPATATVPRWAFGVDTTSCIGCGHCVEACKLENHVPLDPEYNRTWVERHAVSTTGAVFVDSPEAGIHGFPPASTAPGAAGATIERSSFVPRLCMQCENPPCVAACPVAATYRTPEGIVLVDQERCIGCGYCVVACPYGARYLVPEGGAMPTGVAGVADKCTWCYQRTSKGLQPACVEVCPVGARIFGDLNDPASPIQAVLRSPDVGLLRPELGTEPRVFYLGLDGEVG